MKIAVLAGGYSPEREVSLTSGTLIANALLQSGHSVALVDVYTGLSLGADEDPSALFRRDPLPPRAISETPPDLAALRASTGLGDALIGPNVLRVAAAADRVFLAMHGDMGENGQLQATLDSFGIRYTGSGYIGCLLSMDKDLSKRLLRASGIDTPDWVYFAGTQEPAPGEAERPGAEQELSSAGGAGADTPRDSCSTAAGLTTPTVAQRAEEVLRRIGLPCVVKPCSCGSSVGVTMVKTEPELERALRTAGEYGAVLVEKKIVGRELTVGVLGDEPLPLVEIVPPKDGFYDYKNKYSGRTVEICPAPVDDEVAKRAGEVSLRAMRALRLEGYARFDYILSVDGTLYCLEANALPGMTPTSLLPLAAGQAGIPYPALCERILALAGK